MVSDKMLDKNITIMRCASIKRFPIARDMIQSL